VQRGKVAHLIPLWVISRHRNVRRPGPLAPQSRPKRAHRARLLRARSWL